MAAGSELWLSAGTSCESTKSTMTIRFLALGVMLAEAETAALSGREREATGHLRELQAHCEKIVGELAADKPGRPKLVVA